MCSYNAVNGVPTCANSYLLQTVLREHWGWTNEEQWVTSDCVRKLTVQTSVLSMSKSCPYQSANCMASRPGISRDFRLRTGLREPLCLLYSWLNPLFCVSNLSKFQANFEIKVPHSWSLGEKYWEAFASDLCFEIPRSSSVCEPLLILSSPSLGRHPERLPTSRIRLLQGASSRRCSKCGNWYVDMSDTVW